MRTFETFLDLRQNSFGFLRLFFALSVLYHHLFPLGGFGKEPIARLLNYQEDVGKIAVISFFMISGFLVTHSLLRSESVIQYGMKRFLRIYPAFWVCLLVTAFFFAPVVGLTTGRTFSSLLFLPDGLWGYISNNFFIFMHQYTISNLLKDNPYPLVFDGSLWTLILEVKAYLFLGILGVLGIVKKKYLVLLIFTVLYILLLFGLRIPEPSDKFLRFFLDNSVLLFLTYFLSGVVFYLFRDSIPSHRFLFITIFFVTLLAAVFGILHQVIPLTLPYIIFYLASVLPFSGVTRYGDFSYGIYIYAFPMQQLLTHFQLNQSFLIYAVLSVLGTVGFAVLSWYVVERPALYFKRVSFSELIVAIYRYFFFPKRPRTVPDKTAKSAANWSNGKKKKARTSLT